MEPGLGGSDRHDQIGLDESGVEAEGPPVDRERVEVVRLAVVDDDLAAEVPRPVGTEEALELAAPGLAAEPGGHEQRHLGRTPASASASSTAASASRRGSSSTVGSGSVGVWTTTVARPPRVAASASEGPASG